METMRQNIFLILVSLAMQAFLFPALWAQEAQTPPTNVAIVNGTAITQYDFDREVTDIQKRLMNMGKTISAGQLQEIQAEVLESLIDRELLYQESQNSGIKVEEALINEKMKSLKGRFPTEDAFDEALRSLNLSEADLTTKMRRELIVQEFIGKKFYDTLSVSDQEAKSFYDNHPEAFKEPGQMRVSQILIKVEPKATTAQRAAARKKIEEIREKINQGAEFGAMAKEFSQGPNSADGGDMGFFGPGDMSKPFENAAYGLAPGEVSGIVETRLGYHLIKSMDKKPGPTIAYKDVKKDLQNYLKQQKIQEQIMTLADELENKGKVERLIKLDS